MAAPLVSGLLSCNRPPTLSAAATSTPPISFPSCGTADTITDSNVTDNGRVPVDNGAVGFNQEAALPETGITLKRINIYHAVQAVEQMMAAGSGGSGSGGDQSNTTGNAIDLSALNGLNSTSATGSIGQDGKTQVGADDIDLYRVDVTAPGMLTAQIGPAAGSNAIDTSFASSMPTATRSPRRTPVQTAWLL